MIRIWVTGFACCCWLVSCSNAPEPGPPLGVATTDAGDLEETSGVEDGATATKDGKAGDLQGPSSDAPAEVADGVQDVPVNPVIQALFANCSEPGGERNIYDLQDPQCPDHVLWVPGQTQVPVTLAGVVVTAVYGDTLFVQEEKGGAYSGISVYTHGLPTSDLTPGDRVDLEGSYAEFYEVSQIYLDSWTVTDTGEPAWPWTAPDPALLADGETAEMLEGVLVRVLDVGTTHTWPDCPHDYGEFEVTGGLRIDDMGVHWTAHLGDVFASITGPLHYTFGNFKIEPRSMEDLQVTQEGAVTALSKCFADECQAPDGEPGSQQIVVTELLVDPYGTDSGQEWIELHNTTDQEVGLDGWEVRDCGEQVTQLVGPAVTIPAGGFLLLGMNSNPATNGGAPVDYSYGEGFYLPNTVGSVLLYDGQDWQGSLVDQVRYSRFDPWDVLEVGRSLERVSPFADGTVPESWVAGSSPYGEGLNQGSPGSMNDAW